MAKSKKNPLDPFALSIGRLCHEWNGIEERIGWLFADVAGMGEGPIRSMVRALTVRDQIAAIRIGLVVIADKDEHERYWCGEVDQCLTYVDNTLRPRRNRYVHDSMWDGFYGVMRSAQAVKIKTAQSRQRPRLEHDVRIERIADLRETVKAVRDATYWIEQLQGLRAKAARDRAKGETWNIWRPNKLVSGPTGSEVPPWSDEMWKSTTPK